MSPMKLMDEDSATGTSSAAPATAATQAYGVIHVTQEASSETTGGLANILRRSR